MPTKTSPLLLLAVLGALAGCTVPGVVFTPDDPTVSTLLSGRTPGRLVALQADGDEVTVPLSGDRSSFLVFSSRRERQDRLAISIAPEDRAYKVQSVAADNFELRLRALERGRALPKPRPYHAQALTSYAPGAKAEFWVMAETDGVQATEARVSATARYVGEHCYVFVDDELGAGRLDGQAQQIGAAFDQRIFPTDARLFGPPLASGVNGDDKITLLVSPAVGNYGRDTTIGYFTVRDLFPPGLKPDDPVLSKSNQRLMLYMSSLVVEKGEPADYLGTIAHEFQHLINASQKLFRTDGGEPTTEELWLDEGLSMYAMEANGYGLGGASDVVFDHVAAYQAAAPRYSLTNWDVDPEGSAYGAVYLFTTYLADRFGETLLKELVKSQATGIANVEAALAGRGTDFATAFTDWTCANLLDHTGLSADPRYGYRSINMLGNYGGRTLRGVHLEPVTLPNTGTLRFPPYSAQYYYVPRGNGGAYRFSLSGGGGSEFGGLVIAP